MEDRTSHDKRRATACHEAGHAVAHIRLGIYQERATIVCVPEVGVFGSVRSEGTGSVGDKVAAGDMVLAYCAGCAALVAAGLDDAVARRGTDDDFEHAAGLIAYWELPGDIETWLTEAIEFMRRPQNVAAVAVVAQHLVLSETLDSDYIERLVDVADGNITEAEFAQYLELRLWQK